MSKAQSTRIRDEKNNKAKSIVANIFFLARLDIVLIIDLKEFKPRPD